MECQGCTELAHHLQSELIAGMLEMKCELYLLADIDGSFRDASNFLKNRTFLKETDKQQ